MSSIAFHEQGWTMRVSGRERARMGIVCTDIMRAQMGDFYHQDLSWLMRVADPEHYLYSMAAEQQAFPKDKRYETQSKLAKSLETWMSVGRDNLTLDGVKVDPFTMALNSAIAWGNDSLKLAAKLHGQCEIHAYCEGKDRSWLADLIEASVACGLFSADPWGYDGWYAVASRLRENAEHPVVTSYSVTESFPNPSMLPDTIPVDDPDDPYETWERYTKNDHWRWGMEKLRSEPSLQINKKRIGLAYGDKMTGAEFIGKVRELVIVGRDATA